VAARDFELETTVAAAPDEAIDFLADLAGHRGLHPFLVRADVVGEGVDDDGPWLDWLVVERPPLGPLRYTIRFPTRVRRLDPTSMRSEVRAAPGCRLSIHTTAASVAGATVVHERTTVTAPALLVGYMTHEARTAHTRTFEVLPRELATPSRAD